MFYFKLYGILTVASIALAFGTFSSFSLITKKVAITITPTATSPSPPQPSDDDSKMVNFLLKIDDGCLSPCWWGLEMGLTSSEQWFDFFQSFSPNTGIYEGNSEVQFVASGRTSEEAAGVFSIVLVEEDKVIIEIRQFYPIFLDIEEAEPSRSGYLNIAEVLEAYNEPDEVTFSHYGNEFIFQLEFLRQGLILEYIYSPQEVNNDNLDGVVFCPGVNKPFRLHIYTVLPGEAFAEHIPAEPSINTSSIEEITEFTSETFTEELIQHPELCLDIPFEGWLG